MNPMDVAWAILKDKQATLPSFDREQVDEMLNPKRRKVVIGAKPGADAMPREEMDRLSDELLQELADMGVGPIYSTEGSSEWGSEPSFVVGDVGEDKMEALRELAGRFGQEAIVVDEDGSPRFENPETGETMMEFGGSRFNPEAPYHTRFQTGQKWEFT